MRHGNQVLVNTDFAKTWPNITIKREQPADAKEWDGKPGKLALLSAEPGEGRSSSRWCGR